MPQAGRQALDIGARDGHFSRLLAERFDAVTALDLTQPQIQHPKVRCLKGNAADMPFADGTFDLVFCAEVIEHVPPDILPRVCREIERVASDRLLIGVPYRQDLRVGRTTCYRCGGKNPPWGHVNSFDEQRVAGLFTGCRIEEKSFVGVSGDCTNALSAALMDFAGNPYGTYEQDEPCIHCGRQLLNPPPRSLAQKIATKGAFWSRKVTEMSSRAHGNWIHVQLRKA
jgi:SAM-dependent methyltransferase